MKVGLTVSGAERVVADAQDAERRGFDYLAAGEHLLFHRPTQNSFISLAAAAGATSHIRLVSSIALLPLYPAVLAAKLASTLDVVSGGRLELGVGAGGEYPDEFAAVGVDPSTRFRRLDEALNIMQTVFGGEKSSFSGNFTSFTDVTMQPSPIQAAGPPIWLGGRKKGAIRRAARYADVWMPYMVDPERMRTTLEEVQTSAADFGRVGSSIRGALYIWICVDQDGDWARRVGVETVSRTYAQDFADLADRYLLLGSPADVLARLAEFSDSGADRVVLQIAAPPEDRVRVIDTIENYILPELQQMRLTEWRT